jgi:hypothetical protein
MIIGTWSLTVLYIISHVISFSVGQCHEQSHKREKERNTMENDGKVTKSWFCWWHLFTCTKIK